MLKNKWGLLAVFLLAGIGFAQTRVLIQGADTDSTPNIVKNVSVDSQGRLKVTSSGGSTSPTVCLSSASKNVTVGTTATQAPATALTNRWTLTVCNSLRNAGSPLVTCSLTGTPTTAATSAGTVLAPGDCIKYDLASGVNPLCISDTASTAVTTEECGGITN